MNHLEEARGYAEAIDELLEEGKNSKPYDGNTLVIAHALIAIAEQLARNNNILTDVGVANGWWELKDKEDK